ncbi:MAG: hypothetical protein ACRDTV_26150 [Mycobacterium sp.]
MTIVDCVKSTVASVLFRCVSWIALPDTDLISPSTSSLPSGGGGCGLGAAVVWLAEALGFAVLSLFEVLHAAIDNAVTPVTARIASRVSRGLSETADINVSPIAGFARVSLYPL